MIMQNIIINFILIFYFLCFSTLDASDKTKPPLHIHGEINNHLNRRLFIIANDPDILKRIDQRENFQTDRDYQNVINRSMDAAKRRLPNVFSTPHLKNAITAVCLADSKVFFWISMDDYVIIGWTPLIEKYRPDKAIEDVVLWFVPRITRKTRLSDAWQHREDRLAQGTWLRDMLKTGMGVVLTGGEIESDSNNTLTLRGSARDYNLEATATKDVIQLKVSLRKTNDTGIYYKIAITERELNDLPTILPFWPPKDD